MRIITVDNSPGIVVIMPRQSPEVFEKYVRLNGWKMKKWNWYHPATKTYKTFDELQELIFKSRK